MGAYSAVLYAKLNELESRNSDRGRQEADMSQRRYQFWSTVFLLPKMDVWVNLGRFELTCEFRRYAFQEGFDCDSAVLRQSVIRNICTANTP